MNSRTPSIPNAARRRSRGACPPSTCCSTAAPRAASGFSMNAPLAKELHNRRVSLFSRYFGQTVLAIGAHPDDLELAVGGTLARLARNGARVVMAIVSIPSDFDTRHAEAKRAAEILGCELRFLLNDGCRRIDDIKTYHLVTLVDAVVHDLEPA